MKEDLPDVLSEIRKARFIPYENKYVSVRISSKGKFILFGDPDTDFRKAGRTEDWYAMVLMSVGESQLTFGYYSQGRYEDTPKQINLLWCSHDSILEIVDVSQEAAPQVLMQSGRYTWYNHE